MIVDSLHARNKTRFYTTYAPRLHKEYDVLKQNKA